MMKRLLSFVLALVMVLGIVLAVPPHVHAETEMTASEACINYIKSMEGFAAIPFWDYAQWTVGFGNRCPDEDLERYRETGIPIEEAHELFDRQLVGYVKALNWFVRKKNLNLSQHQYDALLSLVYNKGGAWMYDDNDPLTRAIIDGDMGNRLIATMSAGCLTADGTFLSGLMRRRLVEANMYINGVYALNEPDNYCYVLFDAAGGKSSAPAQGYDCNLYAEPWATATRDGYVFQGWYTAATGGVRVTTLDESMDGMTLYAHWVKGGGVVEDNTQPSQNVTVTGSVVNVRRGPGLSYSVVTGVTQGTVISITQVQDVDGVLWGKFEKGWICLTYTTYKSAAANPPVTPTPPEDEEESDSTLPALPMYGKVVGTDSVAVYNGPHTSYPKVGTLYKGDQVVILETYELFGVVWGRCENGWIRTDRYVLFDGYAQLAHPFQVEVTNTHVFVRTGPGTNFSQNYTAYKGTKMTIVSVLVTEDYVWGRFEDGWIALRYTDYNSTKLEYYRNHSMGQWYESKAPTCAQEGQQRRDCAHCEHYETRSVEKLPHSFGQWEKISDGNCSQLGKEQRTCADCGHQEQRDTVLGTHVMDAWFMATDPGCESEGLKQRNCKFCDYFETESVEAAGHSLGQWYAAQDPNCTDDGQMRRDCANCDYYESQAIPANGHSYGQWNILTGPTCSSEGRQEHICQVCGYVETEQIPMTEHTYGFWYEILEPTATEEGQERRDCIDCDHFETRVLDVTEHIYEGWYESKAPTCTEPGEVRKDCIHCDHFEIRQVAATGHVLGQWETVTEPACTEPGEERRICTHCDHYESNVLQPLDHSFAQWEVTVSATCTQEGQMRRNCTACDYFETQTLEPTGHTMGQWEQVTAPACTQPGEETRCCANCEYTENQPVEPTGHTMGQWVVTIAPSCTEPGEESSTCIHCDHTQTQSVQATGHTMGQWVVTTAPSCTEPGEESSTCIHCDHTQTQVAQATGHTMGQWTVTTAPTCTEAGEESRSCANCEHTETQVAAAAGHTMSQWVVTAAPTCTADGLQKRTCACGHTETEVLKATGHSLTDWNIIKAPTYVLEGLRERSCQSCSYEESEVMPCKPMPVEKLYGTVTYEFLNIRAAASAEAELLGQLKQGDRVQILEKAVVGESIWGRIDQGWICLSEYVTLESIYVDPETGEEIPDFNGVPPVIIERVYATISCTALTVRSGAGTGYARVGLLYHNERVEILEQTVIGTVTWGRTEYGWICLTGYTTLETVKEEIPGTGTPEEPEEPENPVDPPVETTQRVFATVTANSLSIRENAGTSYGRISTLNKGQRVEIFEQKQVGNATWGRMYKGWICLTGYTTIEIVETETEDPGSGDSNTKTYGTLTGSNFLNIREDAGTNYKWVGSLSLGDRVEILEQKQVGNATWGRIEQGWICITGYMTLETVEEETPVDPPVEDTPVTPPVEDTPVTPPVEEDPVVPPATETVTKTYGTLTGGDFLNIREGAGTNNQWIGTLKRGDRVEILETAEVGNTTWGRIEQGWICLTGYMTLETVEEEAPAAPPVEDTPADPPVEDVPVIPPTEETVTKTYGTLTGGDFLNIREGAGTNNQWVGTLKRGDRVEILETAEVGNTTWGRTNQGWVCLTGYMTLETVELVVVAADPNTKTYGTLTGSDFLNIREGAGTNNRWVGTLKRGDRVEILETAEVGNTTWGRIEQGWICITGYMTLETV